MLMNLKRLQWDRATCSKLKINPAILPTIRSNAEIYAHVKEGVLKGVPIGGVRLLKMES